MLTVILLFVARCDWAWWDVTVELVNAVLPVHHRNIRTVPIYGDGIASGIDLPPHSFVKPSQLRL